tara:strand:+ start:290 stop:1486 length:1197 start_codon:yes stop_codon:yes gene_type:complete
MSSTNNELSEKHLKWWDLEKKKQVFRERDTKAFLNNDYATDKQRTKAVKINEKNQLILKFFETRERNKENDAEFKKRWGKKLKELNKEFAPKKSTPKPVAKTNPKLNINTEYAKKIELITKQTQEERIKEEKEKERKFNEMVIKNRPKPVAKKTTPKPVIEKADKEKAKLKKLEPKKQTADQLEKRRIKYQENREKELARKRAYREANKQEINAKQDAYRKTGESKEYQKAYREKNAKIFEPRRTATEVKLGVKAYGLGKGMLRYKKDIDELMKKNTDTPRKVRNDAGKSRGEYKKKEKVKLVRVNIPEPKQKSGESSEVFATRLGLWDMVRQGKLSPANLTMRKAVLLTYEGITYDGESITTAEWIRRLEKNGRDIEKDGLGVGNLKMAEIDPDAVY